MAIVCALCAMFAVEDAFAWTWWWNRGKEKSETTHVTAKREFRGVWIQTVFQDRYMKQNTAQNKRYLANLVTQLKADGINAIIFQVRPEGDAFYESSIEPWSRFLTGKMGRAPQEKWDPMAYLIEICHQQNIEFHAWINPYRMGASKGSRITHPLYEQHPDWFVNYGGKWYLNPGRPESRAYIREVVKDIVRRYDVDAIHMDDYFYPYPEGGEKFADAAEFQTYAPMMNIDLSAPDALGNFRRRNVDILIKYLHQDIQEIKPWVKFGISPFGIYRNKSSWKHGSQTNGLQCYDDLYADVLKWAQSGWIDYVMPQLYWEIGHANADFAKLAKWWNDHTPSSCQLFVGISIERSLDDPKDSQPAPDLRTSHTHFMNKMNLCRDLDQVDGECFWYGYQIEQNAYHVADLLVQNVYQQPAFTPAFSAVSKEAPAPIRQLNARLSEDGLYLSWPAAPNRTAVTYCIYKFPKGDKVKTTDLSHLWMRTSECQVLDKDIYGSKKYTYVVTVVDRFGNESKGEKKKVKINIE